MVPIHANTTTIAVGQAIRVRQAVIDLLSGPKRCLGGLSSWPATD